LNLIRKTDIFKEAYEQNAVLTQADEAELLGVRIGVVGKHIREYRLKIKLYCLREKSGNYN